MRIKNLNPNPFSDNYLHVNAIQMHMYCIFMLKQIVHLNYPFYIDPWLCILVNVMLGITSATSQVQPKLFSSI